MPVSATSDDPWARFGLLLETLGLLTELIDIGGLKPLPGISPVTGGTRLPAVALRLVDPGTWAWRRNELGQVRIVIENPGLHTIEEFMDRGCGDIGSQLRANLAVPSEPVVRAKVPGYVPRMPVRM